MVKVFLICLINLLPIALVAQNPIDKNTNIDTTGQKDLIDIGRSILKDKPREDQFQEKKRIYFSILPISTSIPGGGTALVTSTTAGIYLGDPKTTYLSSVSFTPYFNLKGRYGLPIRSSIWLKDNSWNIQGDTRFLVYPQYTWGLGGKQRENNKFLVNYKYLRFYQSALKRLTSYFYLGIGYDIDYYIDVEGSSTTNSLSTFTKYRFGTLNEKSYFSSGPTLNLLYDTRKNSLNPFPGIYANVVYRYNSTALGSDNNWQSLYADFRKYVSLTDKGPKNILAFWSFYWTSLTTGAPFLNLPAIGMDPYQRSGRGIEQNRYRGRRLIYFESEYRRDITSNGLLGFVVFANVNSASQYQNNKFLYWNPAAGSGLRIKFNKKSDTNICIDYGFSKNYSNAILSLGEAF
ncbi:hypothetical protein [Mucilaginibacter sp.]|uniref:hypothetical protein n=1 Tax=Mucilaginibacter sp. TaxID=1882438 RepID=UPI003D1213B2